MRRSPGCSSATRANCGIWAFLEAGKTSGFDPVEGYRIKHSDYALPDVDLTPDEAAAVAVATKLWESPERITAAQTRC